MKRPSQLLGRAFFVYYFACHNYFRYCGCLIAQHLFRCYAMISIHMPFFSGILLRMLNRAVSLPLLYSNQYSHASLSYTYFCGYLIAQYLLLPGQME